MTDFVKAFLRDEEGVTAIEYGLLAAVIALVMVVGATTLGTELGALYGRIGDQVKGYVSKD